MSDINPKTGAAPPKAEALVSVKDEGMDIRVEEAPLPVEEKLRSDQSEDMDIEEFSEALLYPAAYILKRILGSLATRIWLPRSAIAIIVVTLCAIVKFLVG